MVAAWAVALGQPLLPWQREAVDVAHELLPDGSLAYRTVLVSLSRRQGKTTITRPAMAHRCDPLGAHLLGHPWPHTSPASVAYTAQSGKDARWKLLDDPGDGWPARLKAAPRVVRRRVDRVRRSNADPGLTWANGSRLDALPPTEDAGRGRDVAMAVVDEARSLTSVVEDALSPAMLTVPDSQLWVCSNAGTAESVWWADKLALGRLYVEAGRDEGVCLIEYAAAEDADPADPASWWAAQPSLGLTYAEAEVRTRYDAAAASGKVDAFRREYLNVWTADEVAAVPVALWRDLEDPAVALRDPVALAVEVDVDRTTATIVAAGAADDGRVVLEVVDRHEGTGWVVDRLEELVARWDPVAVGVDGGGPAGALELEDVPGLRVLNARDMAQASGGMHDALCSPVRRLAHRADPRLEEAAKATRRRPAGGAWLYDRRAAPADASAWVAAVIARHLVRRELRAGWDDAQIR